MEKASASKHFVDSQVLSGLLSDPYACIWAIATFLVILYTEGLGPIILATCLGGLAYIFAQTVFEIGITAYFIASAILATHAIITITESKKYLKKQPSKNIPDLSFLVPLALLAYGWFTVEKFTWKLNQEVAPPTANSDENPTVSDGALLKVK